MISRSRRRSRRSTKKLPKITIAGTLWQVDRHGLADPDSVYEPPRRDHIEWCQEWLLLMGYSLRPSPESIEEASL